MRYIVIGEVTDSQGKRARWRGFLEHEETLSQLIERACCNGFRWFTLICAFEETAYSKAKEQECWEYFNFLRQ